MCYVAWNKAVRRLLNVSPRTHTWMLGPIMEQLDIKVQLELRSLRFMHMLILSKNKTVQHVASVTLSCAHSTMGLNYAYLYHKYDICIYSDMLNNLYRLKNANELYDPVKISTVCNVRTYLIASITSVNYW